MSREGTDTIWSVLAESSREAADRVYLLRVKVGVLLCVLSDCDTVLECNLFLLFVL